MSESVIDTSVDKKTETAPAENHQAPKEGPQGKHLPKTTCALSKDFFAYGCSLQGKSHIGSDTPCQDFSDARIVEKGSDTYVIAAVADGVGSCHLSHYGAAAAVKKVMKVCAQGIADLKQLSDENILALLRASFAAAQEHVELLADKMQQLTFSFFSTLTVCIYDGEKLHVGHIGDDGVVALFAKDHSMELVTKRHKGEEANSVRPLQSGESAWQFLTVEAPVDGFILATDGVLDSFVKTQLYENMVYAPFATNFLFQPIMSKEDLEELLNSAVAMLDGKGFRERVSDDISLIAVGNRMALHRKKAPAFDINKWNAKIDAVDKQVRETLYSKSQNTTSSQQQPITSRAQHPASTTYSPAMDAPACAKSVSGRGQYGNAYPRPTTPRAGTPIQPQQTPYEAPPFYQQQTPTPHRKRPSGSEKLGEAYFNNHQGSSVPPYKPHQRRKSWLQNLIDYFAPPKKQSPQKRADASHYSQDGKKKGGDQ